MPETALEISKVSKHFGGVKALSEVDLTVRAGEVHGLLGQNGSGKSTLIKILAGYHGADGGEITMFGEPVSLPIVSSQDVGIAVIHQDLGLVDSMTVMENIGVSDGFGRASLAPVRWRSFRRDVQKLMERLDCDVSPDQLVAELRGSDRSMVAIGRSMRILERTREKHVFILDEPTAYLGAAESERLMNQMRRVAAEGSSVLFVSHKLGEVLSVTDRCTILRDGRSVATVETSTVRAEDLVSLQLGRDLGDFYPPIAAPARDEVTLRVDDLALPGVEDVSLAVRRGEIVGLTGLVGMGQDEVIMSIAGALPRQGGTVTRDGSAVGTHLRDVIESGIVLVPEDRKGQGLWLDASARENFTLPASARGAGLRPVDRRSERKATLDALTKVGTRPLMTEGRVGILSGGNQQKVLMAKWMATAPEVLLLHEPTQGVDAAARREIIELINEAAELGTAVVVASTDYEQLAHMCHRTVVFRDGRLVDELRQPYDEADLLLSCQGSRSEQQARGDA